MKYFKLVKGTVAGTPVLKDMTNLSVNVSAPNLDRGMKKIAFYLIKYVGVPDGIDGYRATYHINVFNSYEDSCRGVGYEGYIMTFTDTYVEYVKMKSNKPVYHHFPRHNIKP